MLQATNYDTKDNGATIGFVCSIDAKVAPHGEANFLVKSSITTGECHIESAAYPTYSYYKKTMPATEFVKKHFLPNVQEKLKLIMGRKCSNYERCEYSYTFRSAPLQFDVTAGQMLPIRLLDEAFIIKDGTKRYGFGTNFLENTTNVRSITGSSHLNPSKTLVTLPAEKYLKYDFNREFLLNKLKTLLLFS